ncbi:MAG TPA: SCO family protein [Gemmatimonadota bacterium]|nr:SCO family protein [Gemmatimonadota bacterium]
MHRSNKPVLALTRFAALVAVAGLAATACAPGPDAGAGDYRGRMLPAPREKPDFSLLDTGGQEYSFAQETEGYVTLVFFGYTYCPDVCPIHMANIAAVLKNLPFELRQQFKVIFITTDPDRDTPERMRAWLDAFDPSFVGLRGTVEEVNEIAAAMWLPPAVRVDVEGGGYEVGHSANVVAFTKDNMAHVMYPFGTRQADWAHDLPKLASETWGTE